MKKLALYFTIGLFSTNIFSSCNSNSSEEDSPVTITIPTEDIECCNAEETFLAYTFLNNGYVKEIPSLRDTIGGKYAVSAYSANGKLHLGYNDLFFTVTKLSNNGYVRNFTVSEITPLMTMTAKGMKHSTPAITEGAVYDKTFPAVHRAWVSYVMSSSDNGYWELSYKISTNGQSVVHAPSTITVDALAQGQTWLKSFKYNDTTYYLTLVNPNSYQTGTNTIEAYISKQGTDKKVPYGLSDEKFTIEIYPTMPDMGNHSSPDNKALTLQDDGSYKGQLNLTMTGTWDIHLHIKDADGNTVAGDEGLSDLYWTVTI
jgi:hypothetical protein